MNLNLHDLLLKVFEIEDDAFIREIFNAGTQHKLETGEYLFHQGEDQNLMYIVLYGRLRAIAENEDGAHILGDIGPGETVGELAFLTEEARMASVLAIRQSLVLEFTPEQYLDLIAKNPKMARSMVKLVVSRLQKNIFETHKTSPPKNIAIVKLQAQMDLEPLIREINKYYNGHNIKLQCYDSIDQSQGDKNELFSELEDNQGINFLICDEKNTKWARQCLIYADLIVVAGDYYADSSLQELEKDLKLYSNNILNKKTYLLLLHPDGDKMPDQTNKWLKYRTVNLHIHLRHNHKNDIKRFARILSNRAIGLVLGGGGAKGFAHIGVVQALQEKGIQIDFLGGTSAGALYGIGMSHSDFHMPKIHSINEEAIRRKLTSRDIAIPVISLMSGKKFKAYLKEMFGNYLLEDIWVNSFCLSTNLSKGSTEIHRFGPIWNRVLASMSIPGIYPPVIIENQLHVDGGVMDNLPIEPMYEFPVDKIIAVSLSSMNLKEVNYTEMPNSWQLIRDKLSGKKKYKIPGITSLIINALTINSMQRQSMTKSMVSHYLELDLKGVGMIDDKNWKEIQKKGYEQTLEYLKSIDLEQFK